MHKTPPDYSEIVNPESDDIVLGWDTSAGKMARIQIGNIVTSRLKYMGLCDASTAAYPASPLAGYVYIISVAGTIGEVEYEINDWIMYDGTAWRKIGSGGNSSESFAGGIFQVDQAGGTGGTYGVLTGDIDGSNAVFTVSQGEYISGSLQVWLNGQMQTQGSSEDWTETSPSGGAFTFDIAPMAGDIISAAYYCVPVSAYGNADTLDGYHADAFAETGHAHTKDDITDLETIAETPTANAIIKAGSDGKINDGWLSVKPVNENLLINGDFQVWQSGTSFSDPVNGDYLADMCYISKNGSGATRIITQGNFAPGQTDVPGNPANYLKFVDTVAGSGETYKSLCFPVEGVAGSSGEMFTFSIYARSAGEENIPIWLRQTFGSGGSSDVTTVAGSIDLTADWEKHTVTYTAPSVSGKTIGEGNFYFLQFRLPLNTTLEIDVARAKLEYGDVPTEGPVPAFGDELQKCLRYYVTSYSYGVSAGTPSRINGIGFLGDLITNTLSANKFYQKIDLPCPMRVPPTVTIYSYLGTAGSVSNASATPADVGANSGIGTFITEKGFVVSNGSSVQTTTGNLIIYHWAADARP